MASKQLKPPIPATNLFNIIFGFRVTEILIQAVRLQIFDKLDSAGEPMKVTKLAQDLSVNHDVLEAMMNACTTMGLLIRSEVNSEVYFTNSEEATIYLTKKSPFNILGVFPFVAIVDRAGFNLEDALKTGKIRLHKAFQVDTTDPDDFFKTLYGTKKIFKATAHGFEGLANTSLHIISDLSLGMFKHAVDLGGCFGLHARTLKSLYPNMKVTLADLKPVIEEAKKQEDNKTAGIEYSECDFMNCATLPQADLYLLGHILHNWSDEHCQQILQNIYQVLNSGGCILILDKVLNQNKTGDLYLNSTHLWMMMINDGKERSEQEYKALLEGQGFHNFMVKKDDSSPCYDAIMAYKK